MISPSLLSSMRLQHMSKLCCASMPQNLLSCIISHCLSSHVAQTLFSYSLDPAHLPLSAESYDDTVHRFLSSIMTRKNDSRETYVILRSDHGLQGERENVIKKEFVSVPLTFCHILCFKVGLTQSIIVHKLSIYILGQ